MKLSNKICIRLGLLVLLLIIISVYLLRDYFKIEKFLGRRQDLTTTFSSASPFQILRDYYLINPTDNKIIYLDFCSL